MYDVCKSIMYYVLSFLSQGSHPSKISKLKTKKLGN